MPFATQVIQLLLISEQRDKDIVSAHYVKQVSHEMCLDVLVDSVLAHLKNNETFILPSQGCFNGVPLFFLHKKSSTAKVTEYSTRMQTRSVVAASV